MSFIANVFGWLLVIIGGVFVFTSSDAITAAPSRLKRLRKPKEVRMRGNIEVDPRTSAWKTDDPS